MKEKKEREKWLLCVCSMQCCGLECVESHLGSVIVGCQSQPGGNTIVL